MSSMTTAAIYTRVSHDASGEQLAVQRQLAECRQIVEQRGWTLSRVYEDNSISASKAEVDRPAYDQLQHDYAAGGFDALVCWDLDRLTRQPRQLEDWIDRAEHHGLKLVTANGEADLTTDGGQMYARIKAAVSRAEVQRKGARQRAANQQRAESGEAYGRRRAWGWLDRQCRVVDEPAAALIRQAVADVLAGASPNDIARQWNAAGVLAPSGKLWWSTTVRATLLRPSNAGIVTRHGEELRDIEPKWTPLFDRATFDALKAELRLRGTSPARPKAPQKTLMGGLARCGKCGSTMQGHGDRRGGYYLCSGRGYGCYRTIRAVILDEFVTSRTVAELIFHGADAYLPAAHVERLRGIGRELDTIAAERQEITSAALSMSSKIGLLQQLDTREQRLRDESADLTKDSAIATLIRGLTDLDLNDDSVNDRLQVVKDRFQSLTLRQQRMLISEFGTYEVLDRHLKPRVRAV